MTVYKSRDALKKSVENSEIYYFEVESDTGIVTWANKSLKSRCSNEANSILNTSIYALIDESYRTKLIQVVKNDSPRPNYKTIWPVNCREGSTGWWSSQLAFSDPSHIIIETDFITINERESEDYKKMSVIADSILANLSILNEIGSIKLEVVGIKEEVQSELISIQRNIEESIDAAQKAEKAALGNKEIINELRKHVKEQFDKHTKEITKLMTSDVIHDSRMEIFETHVKKTTSEALTQIAAEADKSGKGLAKKITLPVGAAGIIIAVIQWFINTYFSK